MTDLEKIEYLAPTIIQDYNSGQSMSYIAAKHNLTYVLVRALIKKAKKNGEIDKDKTNKGVKVSFNTAKTVGCVSPEIKRKKLPEGINKLKELKLSELGLHEFEEYDEPETEEVSSVRGFKLRTTKGSWLFNN